jgi:hypothetical protein
MDRVNKCLKISIVIVFSATFLLLVSCAGTPRLVIGPTYSVGTDPVAICFDGDNIWTANLVSDTVTKLRSIDGALLGTYDVGHGPSAICFDGANIWTANDGSNNVTKLNAADGSLLGTYTVGVFPSAICFDGDNIWTANYGSNNVTKLNAADGSLLGTYCKKPRALTPITTK